MVEYFADKRIEINHQPVTIETLEDRLREIYRERADGPMARWPDGLMACY